MDAAGPLPGTMIARQTRGAVIAPGAARGLLALAVIIATVAAAALAAPSAHALGGDPALTRLLRAMAVIKAGMAAGLVAGVFWRLGVGATPLVLAAYAVVSASLASGPVLIWGMTNLVLGALLLHAGLLAGLVLLWRDPATTRRLQALIARRRLARMGTLG